VRLEVIVAHLKSNFINQGQQWEDPARRLDFVKAALRNRRRIATEAMRIRQHLERRLDADANAAVVVLGDLNDGPGQDYFEALYLAHNVTDILLGSPYRPEQLFNHAQADVAEADRFTAVFDDFVTNEPNKHLLLDHIMLSPPWSPAPPRWPRSPDPAASNTKHGLTNSTATAPTATSARPTTAPPPCSSTTARACLARWSSF
jgi:endonuclease/exonuclease/phosphatase family metal-dependent hydrolase